MDTEKEWLKAAMKEKDEENERLKSRIDQLVCENNELYTNLKEKEATQAQSTHSPVCIEIPNNVKIGFKDYYINKLDTPVIDGSKVCYGTIQFDDGIINISNVYSQNMQECTLIHEALHGIDDIHEVGLEEEQIRKLAKGVYAFIKDNINIFRGSR